MELVKLIRAQIGRPVTTRSYDLDITVKSAQGAARLFAPTWHMVMSNKRGQMSDAQYTSDYRTLLDRGVSDELARKLYEKVRSTGTDCCCFRCYCADGRFCHTHLLIDYLVQRFPGLFIDGR